MSIETLLLLVFFLVLPLIQMLREARQQTQKQGRRIESGERQPMPAQQPSPQAQPPEWAAGLEDRSDRPGSPEVPVVTSPEPVRQKRQNVLEKAAARRRPSIRDSAAEWAATPATAMDYAGKPRDSVGLRSPGGLRRAIVAMVILGPCRAVDPHG